MSLYVYAIAGAPIPLTDLRGVGGEALRNVASSDGSSHAIAGDISGQPRPLALNAETLRAQDALVRDLAARADALLPSRFGSRFADEQALRQTLDELAPRLERALTRVRGREQMTIRLFQDAPLPADGHEQRVDLNNGDTDAGPGRGPEAAPRPEPGPGTRYMRQRAAEARQLPAVVEMLRAGIADVVDDERVERGQSSSSPVIGSIHHLIPRGSAERYRARLERGRRDTRVRRERNPSPRKRSITRLRVRRGRPVVSQSDPSDQPDSPEAAARLSIRPSSRRSRRVEARDRRAHRRGDARTLESES